MAWRGRYRMGSSWRPVVRFELYLAMAFYSSTVPDVDACAFFSPDQVNDRMTKMVVIELVLEFPTNF
jgi:hypothetical protein